MTILVLTPLASKDGYSQASDAHHCRNSNIITGVKLMEAASRCKLQVHILFLIKFSKVAKLFFCTSLAFSGPISRKKIRVCLYASTYTYTYTYMHLCLGSALPCHWLISFAWMFLHPCVGRAKGCAQDPTINWGSYQQVEIAIAWKSIRQDRDTYNHLTNFAGAN